MTTRKLLHISSGYTDRMPLGLQTGLVALNPADIMNVASNSTPIFLFFGTFVLFFLSSIFFINLHLVTYHTQKQIINGTF